ncbi:helix-turn-helix domain-containing protein [Streptomyces antibioticus]|uniref:helix-turn-helix domain-containing protein n=1 Tax=Streptomyces antibioticus TaxID=1890 RepID=UPI002252510F|nr:helix-turn-helix transcriptional regulator [Streptomyces antibioticus]MCX5170567.1 helix-turn-helix domain-containing protein [Streptomyces antibioticus]
MDVRERRTPPPEFGPMLRAARERAGLGVRETARQAGLSAGYLTNLEHGSRSPSRSTAQRLADTLGMDEDERARVLAVAVSDAGRDHPWRQSFKPRQAGACRRS